MKLHIVAKKMIKQLARPLIVVALVGIVGIAINEFSPKHVGASCTNMGARGQVEADFNAPVNGNYNIWVQAKGPANAVLYGGIQGKGDCTSKTASSLNTSAWSWVAVSSSPIALTQGAKYQLNLSTDTAGVSMQNARLINNECNPNLNNGCPDETVSAPTNSAPVVTGLSQTTLAPAAPATLNFTVSASDDSQVNSVTLLNAANGSSVGTMTKGSATNQYVLSLPNYTAGTYSFAARATDNGNPAKTTTSSNISVTVASTVQPPVDPAAPTLGAGTFDDGNAGIKYSSGWNVNSNAAGENKYGGADHWTANRGSVTTIKFKGTGITVYAAKASWHGIYSVSLDGAAKPNIDTYSASRIDQAAVLVLSGLTNADHTLVLTNTGNKNAASSNIITAIDRVDVSSTTAPAGDTVAPSAPANLSAAPAATTKVNLSWTASTDNVGVVGYDILRNGVTIATTSTAATTYSDSSVVANTSYSYAVKAYDAARLRSASSNTVSVTTPSGTTNTAPVGPAFLREPVLTYNGWAGCKPTTGCAITLSWDAATDDSGTIDHYDVYNGDKKVNTAPITSTSYADTNVQESGYYKYKVFAYDKQGLASGGSTTLSRSIGCTNIPILFWTLSICGLNAGL